jgi:hypothetical protein
MSNEDMIKVIEADSRGETIQFRLHTNSGNEEEWDDVTSDAGQIMWDFDMWEFRVKPREVKGVAMKGIATSLRVDRSHNGVGFQAVIECHPFFLNLRAAEVLAEGGKYSTEVLELLNLIEHSASIQITFTPNGLKDDA